MVWTFAGQSRLCVASVSVAPQAPPWSHQWWPTHWSPTVGPGGGTSALVPGPPGQRGQLPAGGSLMPRFKCKFPGHRAPTAGPTTTLELLNGGGGDSTDDVSLQGAGAASKHATHWKLWQHSPRTKIQGDVNKQMSSRKKIGQFPTSENVNYCAVCWPSGGGGSGPWGPIAVDNQRSDQKLILGDRLDLFSANRSKIDPK